MSETTQKSANLQILRAVAAMLVVWAHSIDAAKYAGDTPGLALGNLENFGAFGVDIFFVISGFIISISSQSKQKSWSQFAADRFFRVAPIFYLLCIPWLLKVVLQGQFNPYQLVPTVSFWPVVDGKFHEPFLPIGWTLSFEMLFYFLMAVALLLRRGFLAPAMVIVVCTFLMLLRGLFGTSVLNFLGNPIIIEFLFGIAIWYLAPRLKWHRTLTAALFMAGMVGLIFGVYVGFGDIADARFTEDATLSLRRVIWWGLPAASLILLAVTIRDANTANPIVALFVFLGDASYSIYLIHLLALLVFKPLALRGLLAGNTIVIVGFFCSICVGCLIYRFIERPITSLLRRSKLGSQALPAPV